MNTQKNSLVIGVIVVVLLIALGAVLYFRQPGKALAPTDIATSTNATSTGAIATSSISGAASTTNTGGYTVKPITAPKGPNPKSVLVFGPSVSADLRTSLNAQFAAAEIAIAKNALDFDAWISLGDIRKAAGDYAGAALDWNYMSELYPSNVVSHANLADLYFHFAPDYVKAASEYPKAIKNDPKQIYLYQDFYQLYADKYPAAGAALEASLKQGIAANPKAADLQVLLARYYQGKGETAEAKTEYQAAIKNAQDQGNTSLATSIQTELSAI